MGRDRTRTGEIVAGDTIRDEILRVLDDTHGRRNWGHQGLLAALRGLTAEEASWIAAGVPHSVWQQINHVAYWKRHILKRVRGGHPRSSQAWPRGGRTAADLRRTREEVDALHRDLRAAVLRLPPEGLREKSGSKYSMAQLLLGELAHESYHIGQIVLTRRLYRRHRRGH